MFLAWGHPIFDCTHTPLNHPYINPSRMYIVIVLLVSFKVGRFISPDVETSFFFFLDSLVYRSMYLIQKPVGRSQLHDMVFGNVAVGARVCKRYG